MADSNNDGFDDFVVEPPHDKDEEDPDPINDPDGDGSNERDFDDDGGGGSGVSSSSNDDSSTSVVVTGGAGSGEPQTTVGQGDTMEEAQADAATNPELDALEESFGTDQPRVNPDDQKSDSTNVVVTGGAGSGEPQTTVGSAQTLQGARTQAALNRRFNASQGTPTDLIETQLGTGQGEGTQRQVRPSTDRRQQARQDQRQTQPIFADAQRANLQAQSENQQTRTRNSIRLNQGTATTRQLANQGVREDFGSQFNQGISILENAIGINIRDNLKDATDLRPDPSGDNILIDNPDANSQAQFTSEPPVILENVGGEQAGGTNIPGETFLVSDIPTEEEQVSDTADFNAGETGLAVSENLEEITGNEQFAESAGSSATAGVLAAEGLANIPRFTEQIINNPGQTASATRQSLSNTVRSIGNRRSLETAESFERQAEQDTLLLGALATPVAGAASGGTVTGLTDSAGVTTAARRASGIDTAKDIATNVRQRTADRFSLSETRTDPAFQAPTDTGTKPNELTSNTDPSTEDVPRNFFGEEFQPETASATQIITGGTPRT